jgi:hypothetical protein
MISQITVNMFRLNTIRFYLQSLTKKIISIFLSSRIPHLQSGVASFKGYVNDVIGCRYEKVQNGHIFENWTPI